MNFDLGTVIAIAAALLFYLRLIILQRQKAKVLGAARPALRRKKNGKNKQAQNLVRPSLLIANKFLVMGGVILMLLGAAAAGIPALNGSPLGAAWWVPVTVGILLMSLGIR